jgi:hypothetical protein
VSISERLKEESSPLRRRKETVGDGRERERKRAREGVSVGGYSI